jgi:adenosylcobinamide-GDP ribazoletransferase
MQAFSLRSILQRSKNLARSLLGAVVFYTIIPLPVSWTDFHRIARWATLIGLAIGSLLGFLDLGLSLLGMPVLTRSAIVVVFWMAITGGLHLDGAIDTADGLATPDSERRLEVMKDSHAGAFGIIAAVTILLLKTAALSDLNVWRIFALMSSAGWGRWGQVVAIALYSYLRETGKGSFHKEAIYPLPDILLGLFLLLGLSGLQICLYPEQWWIPSLSLIVGSAIALLSGLYFNRQLGGHTGDTYGAVVEVRFVG